jgi:hypothetical protein
VRRLDPPIVSMPGLFVICLTTATVVLVLNSPPNTRKLRYQGHVAPYQPSLPPRPAPSAASRQRGIHFPTIRTESRLSHALSMPPTDRQPIRGSTSTRQSFRGGRPSRQHGTEHGNFKERELANGKALPSRVVRPRRSPPFPAIVVSTAPDDRQ